MAANQFAFCAVSDQRFCMRLVALLRGINVGGNTMINMAELRQVFEGLGYQNVTSYINSGNLAFDANLTETAGNNDQEAIVAGQIERAVEANFGRAVPVMVREQNLFSQIIAQNPFEGQYESHKEMHVLFLKEPLTAGQIVKIEELRSPQERFITSDRQVYVHLPMGVADSILGKGQFERKLGVTITARNWRTVEKLAVL